MSLVIKPLVKNYKNLLTKGIVTSKKKAP